MGENTRKHDILQHGKMRLIFESSSLYVRLYHQGQARYNIKNFIFSIQPNFTTVFEKFLSNTERQILSKVGTL